MTATVRLNEGLSQKLNELATTLHKKKSDVIREAIEHYANAIEADKKSRILNAVDKVKHADLHIYNSCESTLNDGI